MAKFPVGNFLYSSGVWSPVSEAFSLAGPSHSLRLTSAVLSNSLFLPYESLGLSLGGSRESIDHTGDPSYSRGLGALRYLSSISGSSVYFDPGSSRSLADSQSFSLHICRVHFRRRVCPSSESTQVLSSIIS